MLRKIISTKNIQYILSKVNHENIEYITVNHVKEDFKNKNLYEFIVNKKPVGIVSVIFDNDFNYFYIKRLLVFKKGKGYAKRILQSVLKEYPICAITPFESNKAMLKIIKELGFEYQYTFLENYLLYVKK